MLQIGKWTGYYNYDSTKISASREFDKTLFDIEILNITDNKFTGKVQDDLATGGTEGIGEIVGTIQGNRIEFVKSMPVMTLIVDNKGTRKTFNKKHRPIYYTGQFASDGLSVSGTWQFKWGFIWLGIIPIPVKPTKGTWFMTQK